MPMDVTFLASGGHTRHWDEVSRKLWEENFDDSRGYCDFYFNRRWRVSSAFFLGEISMMHLCPYPLYFAGKEFLGHYLVGVCTDEAHRRKGYMARLLGECYKRLYKDNVPFLYLMPADTKIYEPFGFRGFYTISPYHGALGYASHLYKNEGMYGKFKISVREYGELSDREKDKVSEFANRCLRERVQCFVKRDNTYFELRAEEMKACHGMLPTFWCEVPIGYAMLMREDGAEISEFLAADGFEYNVLRALENVLTADERRDISFCETMFLGKLPGVKKNLLMGRIISLESFMSLLKKTSVSVKTFKRISEEYGICGSDICSIYLDITDSVIADNSGLWEITACGDILKTAGANGVMENIGKPNNELKLEIEEFFELVVKECRFYLNEMV